MRGIADQRQPLADERARDEIPERKRARLVEGFDLAELQPKTPFEFAVKLADSYYVMDKGAIALSGRAGELDKEAIKPYLAF